MSITTANCIMKAFDKCSIDFYEINKTWIKTVWLLRYLFPFIRSVRSSNFAQKLMQMKIKSRWMGIKLSFKNDSEYLLVIQTWRNAVKLKYHIVEFFFSGIATSKNKLFRPGKMQTYIFVVILKGYKKFHRRKTWQRSFQRQWKNWLLTHCFSNLAP